ncbi:Uncharacterized protein APZ42_032992 [Daphnia magna]|uniref:Uncharacterized protein n=1 Tax=Daphnia magna TaxID=35525 RepID=A0A164LIQ4_9CRUS|nr:Uncharacterized protein APZ42_032992 [Daphnia magna]
MPFDSPVQKTALKENTLLSLHPVLQESDLTDQDPNLSHRREQFFDHWKTLIDLELKEDLIRSKSYQTISTTEIIQQLQTQKQEASQATQNSLHFYTYYLQEQTIKVTDGVTAETIANATKILKEDKIAQGGNTRTLDCLLQQLHTLHGKEKEFLFGTISVLQKNLERNLELGKQLESNKKKAKSSKYTLSSSLEHVQKNNDALKNSLEKANFRITDLEQSLENTLATENQLQNIQKRKKENHAAVETEGQEIINKLEDYHLFGARQSTNKKKVDIGVTHDDKDTSKNPTQKTFANNSKKNSKDDDIQSGYEKKKLSKLTQKPEENRAFVSRLNNLYDTIAGKEERTYRNQTIIKGQLLNKVKKMRDHRKCKNLLQGLIPIYKAELYLGMPENRENFDALCKQRFISEKILHTKEATDHKEMSAVIAEITHHEKEQDDKIQLLEQKLTKALSEFKCTNTKRGSSQENDVTIAATDQ